MYQLRRKVITQITVFMRNQSRCSIILLAAAVRTSSIMDPSDTYIVTVPLLSPAGFMGLEAKPNPVLVTRLKRLPTLTFSRP
jgi:hypothetical protein